MTKNPKHPAGNVARKVGSGFLEHLLSFLEAISLQVVAGIKHLTGLKRFIAKEDEFDGRMMLRLGAWGIGSIVALVVAIIAVQSPASARRDQASVDVTQQSQQLQLIAKESQNQTRQLSAAMDTLNKDRDRLYNRVTVLEQALDSINGSIAKLSAPPPVVVSAAPASVPTSPLASTPSQPAAQQAASDHVAASPVDVPMASVQPVSDTPKQRVVEIKKEAQAVQAAAPPVIVPPKIASVATVSSPTPPSVKSEQAATKPDAKASEVKAEEKPAGKPSDQAAAPEQAPATTGSVASAEMPSTDGDTEKPVDRTKFGVDLGGANSIEGLRALWRGLRGPYRELFAEMQPLIVIKERTTGRGTQLRLVAGPLTDAAAAAKLCASLTERSKRACEPSVYDGQRLAMNAYQRPEPKAAAAAQPDTAKPEEAKAEAAAADAAKPEPPKKREASNYRRRVHVRVAPTPAPQQPAAPPPAPAPQRWSLSTIFSGRQ